MSGKFGVAGAVVSFGPAIILALVYLLAPGSDGQRLIAATGAFAFVLVARAILLPPEKDVLAAEMFDLPWLYLTMIVIVPAVAWWFQDETIIKVGPTIYFALVAVVSVWSVASGRPRLQHFVKRESLRAIGRLGWRDLTLLSAAACASMALINEIVWRNGSTGFWLAFQLFGWLLVEMIVMFISLPIMKRHDFKYSALRARDGDRNERASES